MSENKPKSAPNPKDCIVTWNIPANVDKEALAEMLGVDVEYLDNLQFARTFTQYVEGEGEKAKTRTAKSQAEAFLNQDGAPTDYAVHFGAERQAKEQKKVKL